MSTLGKDNDEDPRMDHIREVTLQSLNIDISYWEDLIWKEESQSVIKDFLDTPATVLLFVYIDRNEKLALSSEIPIRPPVPKIMGYFLKNNIAISMADYKREIMCGNVFNFPLQQYQQLFEKVFNPIFCNLKNNSRWPVEISSDITLHFEDFRRILTYHVGLAEGKTVLVIPHTAKLIENFDIDNIRSNSLDWRLRNVLNAITEMLDNWIPIVSEVLELTSEHILSKVDQGPTTEISFWIDRKRNLEFIHSQLNDPSVKKMMLALEKINSCYFPLFRKLLQDIAEGLDEAFEISNSLSVIRDQLQELETCEFPKLMDILPTAVEVITLSWINSKYFNSSPSRISVLVQKTCNLLIEKVKVFLNPQTLFKEERDEMKEKVKTSINVLNLFLKSFCICGEQMNHINGESKVYPWEFPDKRVFDRFEKFMKRLNEINDIFEAADVYCNIPKYKIPGVQQIVYRLRLKEFFNTFCENYSVFEESAYNPLDLKSDAFVKDNEVFTSQVAEMDRKLGIVIGQACTTITPAEEGFRMINLFQDLIKRPVVNTQFKKMLIGLVINIYKELAATEENFNELVKLTMQSVTRLTYKNLPAVSGAVQCSVDLQKKLTSPLDSLKQIEHYFTNADDADMVLKIYQETEKLLAKFRDVTIDWEEALDHVNEKLDENVLQTNNRNEVYLNFDFQISDLAEEIRYIKLIKKESLFPCEVLKFYEISETILKARSLLASAVRWVNDLSRNLVEYEKNLVSDKWNEISCLTQKGQATKWTNNDLQNYTESIYCATKSVFESVKEAKENVEKVQTFIESWNKIPMFVRESTHCPVDFSIYMTPRVREQISAAKQTALMMNQVLEENLLLFKCCRESGAWKSYVIYLESIIESGLKNAIKCSLQYLLENTDASNKKLAPFYKVYMMLEEDIEFKPPLVCSRSGSLEKIFDAVVEKIYSPSREIKRMSDTEVDYYDSISLCPELNSLKNVLSKQVASGAKKALSLTANFMTYSELWQQKIEEALEDFILYGPVQETETEGEDKDESEMLLLEIKPPTEEEFRTQIAQFDLLQRKVDDISVVNHVDSWLILDVSLFKESLLSLIRNWSSAYKKKLVELKSQGKLRKLEEDGDT